MLTAIGPSALWTSARKSPSTATSRVVTLMASFVVGWPTLSLTILYGRGKPAAPMLAYARRGCARSPVSDRRRFAMIVSAYGRGLPCGGTQDQPTDGRKHKPSPWRRCGDCRCRITGRRASARKRTRSRSPGGDRPVGNNRRDQRFPVQMFPGRI